MAEGPQTTQQQEDSQAVVAQSSAEGSLPYKEINPEPGAKPMRAKQIYLNYFCEGMSGVEKEKAFKSLSSVDRDTLNSIKRSFNSKLG